MIEGEVEKAQVAGQYQSHDEMLLVAAMHYVLGTARSFLRCPMGKRSKGVAECRFL
jgi:hypothetical protein